MSAPVLAINPTLDRAALAAQFARDTRVQIANVLTPDSAATLRDRLARETPWGLAIQAGDAPAQSIRAAELATMTADARRALVQSVETAMARHTDEGDQSDYGFMFHQYPMLDAYLGGWAPGGLHDRLLEDINDAEFLGLARDVTGFDDLIKADAQATLYAPGQFLALHHDSHVGQGWRVAYVLNLTTQDWRADWGGMLLFHDADGNVTGGFRPIFNSLNLFAVPQAHSVSLVSPFAPLGRLAVTGWLRNG